MINNHCCCYCGSLRLLLHVFDPSDELGVGRQGRDVFDVDVWTRRKVGGGVSKWGGCNYRGRGERCEDDIIKWGGGGRAVRMTLNVGQ